MRLDMTIAVTTPTGHVGSHVVRLLLQAGVRPRLLVRDPGKLDPAVRERADLRTGDLADADYLSEATTDVESLLWVVPESFTAADPLGDIIRLGLNAAAAVRANAIARVVMISSVGAERVHGVGLIDGLARNEAELGASGAALTLLRCGYFFTNLHGTGKSLKAGLLTTTMTPDAPMPWVDPRDVAEVAAVRLLAPGWTGRTVQAVHGPADLSWADVASTLGEVLGRKIRLEVLSDDELRARLRDSGMPPNTVEGMIGMTAGLREGFTPEQPRDYVTTTPTTLAAWAWENLRGL